MAEPPIKFKRSKTKQTTARNRDSPAPNAEHVSGEPVDDSPSPAALATKVKNKAKQRVKPKTTLSFGGDDEDGAETFTVKKSSLSRKLTLGVHPALSPPNISSSSDQASSSRSGGVVYDEAYLSQLKASTPSTRPPRPADDSLYDADVDMAIDTGAMIEEGAEGLQPFAANETVIPSESSVTAAKEKRERLRANKPATATNGEDFISLSVTKRTEEWQGPHPESRLMREDDDLGEGDDEFAEYTSAQERIALGKKSKKAEASKRRDAMKELIADAEEVDDESKEWEDEQLRRSGLSIDQTTVSAKQVYVPTPIPMVTLIPTLDPAVEQLTRAMTSLTQSHAQNTATLASLGAEQAELENKDNEMRELITAAESKRSWFVAFRDWVESVAAFLDEKYPLLETVENEHISLMKERREMIKQRRRAEDEDDFSIFLGSFPVPPEAEELDELGRLVPHPNSFVAKRERKSARVARRARRRQRALPNSMHNEEGWSTDSALPPSDATDYEVATEKMLAKKDQILEDVKAEDFRNPNIGIGKWFDEWRRRYEVSYTQAYGGLGLVGAWEFWIRLEMAGWNPLEDNAQNLDTFQWYTQFHHYSRPRNSDLSDMDEGDELGPDGDLVPEVLGMVIIPRLKAIIEGGALDPYSETSISRLRDLVDGISLFIPIDHPRFQPFLLAVFNCFKTAVTDMEALERQYLALNSPTFDPEAMSARTRVLARQRKLLSSMIKWREVTRDTFKVGELIKEFVRECMTRVAETGWDIGGQNSMHKVVRMCPRELLPHGLKLRMNIL